jgi:hypothetical protein
MVFGINFFAGCIEKSVAQGAPCTPLLGKIPIGAVREPPLQRLFRLYGWAISP